MCGFTYQDVDEYATVYDIVSGETVISYRGTDSGSVNVNELEKTKLPNFEDIKTDGAILIGQEAKKAENFVVNTELTNANATVFRSPYTYSSSHFVPQSATSLRSSPPPLNSEYGGPQTCDIKLVRMSKTP
jgi:hypothetical protein